MTYTSLTDARTAIREFDGANANGQPIRLTLLPIVPSSTTIDSIRGRGGVTRNPFDTAVKPSRSLFERIEDPGNRGNSSRSSRTRRSRSRSPGAPRRTNTNKPAPDGIDRYVPGPDTRVRNGRSPVGGRRMIRSRTRSPTRKSGRTVNGREKKTQEELDREMEDYWGSAVGGKEDVKNDAESKDAAIDDGDIDMIE